MLTFSLFAEEMMENIPLGQRVPMNSFRYSAVWAWGGKNSPDVFLPVEFNVTPTLAFLAECNTGVTASISVFHAFLKAMGLCLVKNPQLNRVLLGQRLYMRQSIDFFIVKALEADNPLDRHDLTGFKLCAPHTLALVEYPGLVNRDARSVAEQTGRRENFWLALARVCPFFLTRMVVGLYDRCAYSLNISPQIFGFSRDQFGSMWVSNIGPLGLPPASVPHFPISRCGLGASVGKTEKKPVVLDNEVVIQDILPVTFTYDHRLYDACHVAAAVQCLKELFLEPEQLV